tara:strand:- start:3690 stop:4343 length:654 start_codon:yes stop_codon:yes gene_type:complete
MIAIIPARGGSKGIPNKNIKIINGKPLIWWSIDVLEKANVDRIIVSTDSVDYKKIIEDFNFSKVEVIIRSTKNSSDTSSTESVLIETINTLGLQDDIILVQATSPLIKTNHINEGINLYEKYDSILSVVCQKRFFWNKDGAPLNYDYKNRPRRQDFEDVFIENGAFYINSSVNIIKTKNRLSGKIGLYEMPLYSYFELDDDSDWEIISKLFELKSFE